MILVNSPYKNLNLLFAFLLVILLIQIMQRIFIVLIILVKYTASVFIEHKSSKVVDMGETAIVDNGLTFQILRRDLEQKVYTLMEMARAGIISLSFAIHLEELKSKSNEPAFLFLFLN